LDAGRVDAVKTSVLALSH